MAISILLVDDNDDDVILIREAFAGEPEIKIAAVAQDGEEALAYLNRQGVYADAPPPDIVFLDINMPRMDGFEVLQRVKQDAASKYLPVVMLTTSQRDEDIMRSYAYGACSYIRKPSDMHEMRNVARNFFAYWTSVSRLPSMRGS